MKKRLYIGGGVIVFAALVAFLSVAPSQETARAGASPGVPVAVFGETKFTWQTAVEGDKVKHTYTVRNKGTAELIIEQVKPT